MPILPNTLFFSFLCIYYNVVTTTCTLRILQRNFLSNPPPPQKKNTVDHKINNIKPFLFQFVLLKTLIPGLNFIKKQIWKLKLSCSGRIRFDSCSLYPQNEIGPSISSSVILGVFVLLVYIVVLVWVSYLCPSSGCVVATFPGTGKPNTKWENTETHCLL